MYATDEEIKRLEDDYETLREIVHHVRKEKKYMHALHMKMMLVWKEIITVKHTRLIEHIEKALNTIGEIEEYIERTPNLQTDLHDETHSMSSHVQELIIHLLEEGHTKEEIRKYLLEHSWHKEMVDGILEKI